MEKLLVALMLVVLAAPAWGEEKNSEYENYQKNKSEYERKYEYESWLSSKCPKGVEDFQDLLNTNPFDNKGRCFRPFPLKPLQILSKNTGLFYVVGGSEPFAFVSFGKRSAPTTFYRGVVRGLGAYQYQSVNGGLVTVHKFVAIER